MTTTTSTMSTSTVPAPSADHVVPASEQGLVRELVARAQGGDAEAFAALYERYLGVIYQFVFFKVCQDQALAQDLTSEVFLRALRGIAGFSWQGSTFDSWLVTIARNLVIDHFRSSRRRPETLGDPVGPADGVAEFRGAGRAGLPAMDRPAGPETDPEARAVAHETNLALARAVNRLPSTLRETVLLRFWLQLSINETAKVLGIRPGAVKSRQARAMRTLARVVPADLRRAGGSRDADDVAGAVTS